MRASVLPLAALLASCAAAPRAGSAGATAAAVPPDSLGLSKTSVFAVPTPPEVKKNGAAPGEGPVLPRDYPGAPPVIPHEATDFTPITATQNSCVDCHAAKAREAGGPPPLPPSHYADLRSSPDKVGERVVGARWVCTSCHVPRTDARPLVGNAFGRPGS